MGTFSFLLGKYLGEKLLSHMVIRCLPFWGSAKLISTVAASFCIHTSSVSGLYLHVLASHWYLLIFGCSHPSGCEGTCHCGFTFLLRILSIFSRAYCIFFGEMPFQILCLLSFRLFVFILLTHLGWVLYIFQTLEPWQIYDLQICSHILWVVFSLSDSVLWCPKVFNFGEVQIISFFFCCLWCHI